MTRQLVSRAFELVAKRIQSLFDRRLLKNHSDIDVVCDNEQSVIDFAETIARDTHGNLSNEICDIGYPGRVFRQTPIVTKIGDIRDVGQLDLTLRSIFCLDSKNWAFPTVSCASFAISSY